MIIEQIIHSPRYKSGDEFRIRQIASDLCINYPEAREALRVMADKGLARYHGDGVYKSTLERHWLHRVRLNDWRAMRALA